MSLKTKIAEAVGKSSCFFGVHDWERRVEFYYTDDHILLDRCARCEKENLICFVLGYEINGYIPPASVDGGREEWISVNDQLPVLSDDSVLVYFSETGSRETVHIDDYFRDITAGFDELGNQLYTKYYVQQKVTHWMPLPAPPQSEAQESKS